MKQLITDFTAQLKAAITIGNAATLSTHKAPLQHVIITGLGGSGIGGTIVSELESARATAPIVVNKDYFLPAFANQHTLVIVSSYSGNTEETLSAFEAAAAAGCKIVCISSGGAVIDKARAAGIDHIIIPGGMPPRACLAYSLTQLFFVLHFHAIIPVDFKNELQQAIALIDSEEKNIHAEAVRIAGLLVDKLPVIYSVAGSEGVAIRFRQQINENSKMLCWHHVLPEMNHNELVGWTEKHPDLAVVILRSKEDYARTQKRVEISKEIVSKYVETVVEITAKGDSALARALYHIHLGDWISNELATLKNIDAIEVNVIDYLKSSLAKAD